MKPGGRILTLTALLALACTSIPSRAAERAVSFKPGATSTTLKGVVRGHGDATFVLQAAAGQVMQTLLTASNSSCYFNVFEPGQQEAAHIGPISGNEFGRSPTRAGAYRFQVYLMRNAARRNATCRYSLSIELTGRPGGASAGVSDREMRDRCQARVAGMYGVASARIRLSGIRTDSQGPRIDGTVNKGSEGIKTFRCLYTSERQLKDVMAMTSDGE